MFFAIKAAATGGRVARSQAGCWASFLTTKLGGTRAASGLPEVVSNPADIHRFHEVNHERHQQLGPIYKEIVGPDLSLLWIADPAVTEAFFRAEGTAPKVYTPEPWVLYNNITQQKRGLFFLEGDEWVANRKALNQVLLKDAGRLASIHDCFGMKATMKLLDDWEEALTDVPGGKDSLEVQDLKKQICRLTVDSFLRDLYGHGYSKVATVSSSGKLEDIIDDMSERLSTVFQTTAKLVTVSCQQAFQNNTEDWQKFFSAKNTSLEIVRNIHEMLSSSNCGGLLELFQKQLSEPKGSINGFSPESLVYNIEDLILGAVDSVTYTTLWTLYKLAKNPAVQEKARNLPMPSRSNYINWCIRESQRLYPVAPFLGRKLSDPLRISSDLVLEKDSSVMISIYSMCRDEECFPCPESWIPERWDRMDPQSTQGKDKSTAALSKFRFLPFSFGVRSCIGKVIALQQMTGFISSLLDRFHLESLNSEEVKLKMELMAIPDRPIQIAVSKLN